MLILFVSVYAQEVKKENSTTFKPGWYMGANGGLNWFYGENNFPINPAPVVTLTQNIGYLGRLELGYQFTPVYSMRSFLGYRLNNYFNGSNYLFSSENLAFDFLFNMTNLTKGYDMNRKLTFSVFAGLGANYINNSPIFPVAGSLRVGIQPEYNINSNLALNLIAEINAVTDNYNKVSAGTPIDLEAALSLGLTYRFPESAKKVASEPVVEPKIEPQPEAIVTPTPAPEPTPAPVVEPVQIAKAEPKPVIKPVEPQPTTIVTTETVSDKINEHIFFTLNQREIKSDVQKESMQRIADFITAHPESKVIISGYADRGTGSFENNIIISKKRAVIVANTLIRDYGVHYKNIWVRWFGDGVQPYAKPSQNRLVIVHGAASFKEALSIPSLKKESTNVVTSNSVSTSTSTSNTKKDINNKTTEKNDPTLFKVVHFVENSVLITDPKAKDEIKLVAEYLERNPSSMVVISGYADNISDAEKTSTELSKNRAQAVASVLINTYSINSERIQVRWFGAQKEKGLTPTMNKMVLINTVK